jgi:F420H(2)-dependent quinone reductase
MNTAMKTLAKVHALVLRLSGGRVGNHMGGQPVLLLHHVGAKSGKRYATPLGYIKDGDAYVVVAAAAGHPHHPGWYYNVKAKPRATIDIKGQSMEILAEVAAQEKRARLWAQLSAQFPQFDAYQKKIERTIPIVLLHPQT